MSIGSVLQQLILPPGGFLILALFGLWLMRRYPRLGYSLTVSGVALLLLASLPVTSSTLMSWLEPEDALAIDSMAVKSAQAIVILGAGRRYDAPEYGGDTPNAMALERIRYGVWLARRTLLPVLVSGGLGDEDSPSEADMMKRLIQSEYALPVRWVEDQSHDTFENAQFSADILKAEGIKTILLVTHAAHMKRSVMSFERVGLTVHAAPTAFVASRELDFSVLLFLPSARALRQTFLAFHEWVGMAWYWLRFQRYG